MRRLEAIVVQGWCRLGTRFLPFADAATPEFPLPRLLRLSLFQVSVGMAVALLSGTLNRVMIVELGVPAWLVSLMVSLPLVFAPFRVLVGYRSDTHRSALGWRRVPYIWIGTLLQFGGLAIMPFALLVLSGDTHGPIWVGHAGAALAFLLVGAGLHTTQTAGLALAADLAPAAVRPRVVALLYVMLLVGMVAASLAFGALLADFTQLRLVQVIQGAALVTMGLNLVALWKQEARVPGGHRSPRPPFAGAWRAFAARPGARRFLVSVGLGTAAFSMQDILLEPYGAEVLGLGVGATALLTAFLAAGALAAFATASGLLGRGSDPHRVAAAGALSGAVAFAAVVLAAPLESAWLFRGGALLIGYGAGLFAIGTLTVAMGMDAAAGNGLALGAWGAVQASAAGAGIAVGGALRDATSVLAVGGALGPHLAQPATGYAAVYHIEIALLFVTLAAIGPLAGYARKSPDGARGGLGLAEFPG